MKYAECELINPDCNWLYTDFISLEGGGANLTIYILLIIIIIFWF